MYRASQPADNETQSQSHEPPMIVCCCFGTTDREIRKAFGPDGDRKCPAGKGCGGCMAMVQEIATKDRQRASDDGSERGAPEGESRPRS